MRTLLINPSSKVNKDLPNMSLAYAATFLKALVIDLNTQTSSKGRYLDRRANVLGISFQTRNKKEAQKIKDSYKEKFPQAKIKSVKTAIDVQCCYHFLDWPDKLEIKKTFNKLPLPCYELFDSFPIFLKHWQDGSWAYPILTSLGCPFHCLYCAAGNRKWQTRTPQEVFEELSKAKKKYQIKSFQIIDDCFSVDQKRAIEICKLVKKLKIPWFCTNGLRADLFDEQLAQALKQSGCCQISFGVESLDDKILKNIKKGETSEQIKKAVEIAKKYFQDINLYFIIGLKGSNFKKDLQNLRWVADQQIKGHFSYFVPQGKNQNAIFYGEGARPVAKTYSPQEQKKIYLMAGYMRGEVDKKRLLRNIILSFLFILIFDPIYFPKHFLNFYHLLLVKIKNR